AVLAKMRNGGEACVAANRFLVHESVAAEFTRRFAERIGAFVPARGTDPTSTVGPLVDAATRDKVASLVDSAVAQGARVAVGGSPIP
ncbi:aldehyde dehydrogenase family protein, partial [Vibrio parahaemolyticus]